MAKLTKNSTPAERSCRCSFSEKFETQALAEENGCVVTGTPSFSIADGVTLGASDSLLYAMGGNETGGPYFSCVFDFTPDFDHDENVTRYLYEIDDGAGGGRYYAIKMNAASSHNILIRHGNDFVGPIPGATYAPFWRVGERNVFVVSSESGNTNVWLNGNPVMVADVTAWTPNKTYRCGVGSSVTGGTRFLGKIHSFQIYKSMLTGADAVTLYNGSTYDYMKDAVAIYEMLDEDHDAAGTRTLDKSGNDYHLPYVNNVAKLVGRRGYTFDGVNDYFGDALSELNPSSDFTVAVMFRADTVAGYKYLPNKWRVAGDQRGWCIRTSGDDVQCGISKDGTAATQTLITKANCLGAGKDHTAVCRYEYIADTTSHMCLCVDGELATPVTNARGPAFANAIDFRIGVDGSSGNDLAGRVYCVYIWHSVLGNIQVQDLVLRMRKQKNDN